MNDSLCDLMPNHISLLINIHETTECQAVFPCIQGTDAIGQLLGEHGNDTVNQVDTGSSFQCLSVKGTVVLYIIAHIGNMHAQMIELSLFRNRHRIIQILCIFPVNGDHGPVPQIHASVIVTLIEGFPDSFRLVQHLFRKLHGQVIASGHRHDIHALFTQMAQNLLHLSLRVSASAAVTADSRHYFITADSTHGVFHGDKNIF